jgi:hypothetical protein
MTPRSAAAADREDALDRENMDERDRDELDNPRGRARDDKKLLSTTGPVHTSNPEQFTGSDLRRHPVGSVLVHDKPDTAALSGKDQERHEVLTGERLQSDSAEDERQRRADRIEEDLSQDRQRIKALHRKHALEMGKPIEGEGDDDAADDDSGDEMSSRLDRTAPEIVDEVNSVQDRDELKAMKKAENKGKARKTVLDAIDRRMDELKQQQ